MSEDIRPGDVVVCVNTTPHPSNGPKNLAYLENLQQGRSYRVRETFVSMTPQTMGMFSIRLFGIIGSIHPNGVERGFAASRFRKIEAPKTELSERIRACRPVKQGQPS